MEEYIQYKNMTYEQKRAYHNQKNREYHARKAALEGRIVVHQNPNSHPSKMSREELLAYRRENARRYRERQKLLYK
jgi:hypothetical protein